MSLILGIAAELSAPPSSPTSFREVCMAAKAIHGYDVLAYSPAEMASAYNRWFRLYGLWDYLDDLLPREQIEEMAVEIECIPHGRLTALNVRQVLAML